MSNSINGQLPGVLTSRASELSGVVLFAYGPRNATRGLAKAMKKASERLGVDLYKVSAFHQTTARAAGGPMRLAAALDLCGDGPVLFIHDDVAIDDVSLDRLVGAHLDGVKVAVPGTNDRGASHFHGPLPAAATARSQLRGLAQRSAVAVRSIDSFRPSCFVADAGTVRGLLDKRIHDPFTMIRDRGIECSVVDGAFAAHDGVCAHQVRASGANQSRPILVASMIVKDEEEMLGDCLVSLQGLTDRVEVVDTGSSDATISVAESAGAVVSHTAWVDDFSAARNVAADRCRDALFTLYIDADERVEAADASLLRDVLSAYSDEIEALDVAVVNLNDGAEGGATSRFRARRIVRSDLLEFTGRIHETTVRKDAPEVPLATTTLDLIQINHLGYSDELVASRNKGARNLRLAEFQHGDDGSVKASLDLARSLMLAGDSAEEAIPLLRDAVAAAENTKVEWSAYLLGSLAHLLMESGETGEAHELSQRAFRLLPTDDLVAAVYGRTSLALDRTAEFIDDVTGVDQSGLPEPVFRSPANARIFEVAVVRAETATNSADHAWLSIIEWAEQGRVFDDDDWVAVAETAASLHSGMELFDAVIPLVAQQPDATGLIPAAAGLLEPEVTAILAIGVVATGSVSSDAVSTGLVASMVSERWDLFDELAPAASSLDDQLKQTLAVRLDERGQHQRAGALLGKTNTGRSLVAGFGGRGG